VSFTIYAPQNGLKIAFPDHDVATAVWQITATKGYFKGPHVKGLQLTYGKVPDGYQQIVPDKSQAPPLASGIVYAFFAETTDAPISTGYLYVGESGPVQTEVPDLCLMFVQGRKVRVKCKPNTAEPYQEPVDLEKYVREHQITQGRTVPANSNSKSLTASQVLRRYKDEDLPAFCEIPLEDVNQVGNFGERPLHVASSRGIMEEIAALVEAGAEVNAPGNVGNTPLHEAVGQGHLKAIQFLLDHGASADVRNEFGETPLDKAIQANRHDIVEVLRSGTSGRA
jgi:hypothetical protein